MNLNYTSTYYLKEMMVKMKPFLHYESYPPHTRFVINEKHNEHFYFIKSGAISLHRYPDGILLDIFEAPTIRGILPFFKDNENEHIVKVLLPSEVAIITKEKAFIMFTQNNVWEDFARYQSSLISLVPEMISKISSPNSYQSVRHQLIELMAKSPEIRELITAENYIRCKTRLSRSSIMRILSDLKSGGYISLERGVLRKINNLPQKY